MDTLQPIKCFMNDSNQKVLNNKTCVPNSVVLNQTELQPQLILNFKNVLKNKKIW